MAFENLTLFELNFDDAHFGPSFSRADDEMEMEMESEEPVEEMMDESPGGRGVMAPLVGFAMLLVLGYAVRRYLGGRDAEEVEFVDADEIELEH